jgi:hypothetical protein
MSNGREKRSIFCNPLLISSFNIVTVIKSTISLLTPEENKTLLIIIGEVELIEVE